MRQLIVRAGSTCPLFKLAALVLAMAFIFGCSSNDEQISPTSESTNSTATRYCVYAEARTCYSTSQLSCPAGGELSDFCPYVVQSSSSVLSSSSIARSSSSSRASSSSLKPSSSSVPTQANIVYGADVTYEGGPYKTVVIGGKTWFQRNLNYAVTGSKCGNGDSLSDANTATCDTYGRLYDWATAMALPSECNTSTCATQVQPKHQGICPSGWHIPSDAEWTALETAVGGSSTADLKARNGWNGYNGKSGNGEDKFGFAALPGGSGNSGGGFIGVGDLGEWWSASENDADNAYLRFMYHSFEGVFRDGYSKSNYLFSVRCLQD